MAATFPNEFLDWARQQISSRFAFDGPGVKLTLPPKSFFKFPPANIPRTLPPPPRDPDFAHPFTIPTGLYNAALSPTVPLTFAIVYVTAITYLNGVNKRRNYRPWAISKTQLFKLGVLVHNILLSLYSLWTFIGMFHALKASIVNPREGGLAATVDSFCKLNGPRGHGSAATFNERNATWSIANRLYRLAEDGFTPDTTDVGRIWNEGLAFYGWIFYLSKFYEVIDTLIIIAKGKKSSFLQTYHHAGAMLCMWAGIRYMSPPIWMFAFVNSFIHTIMYTFYTCITLGIKVPKTLKRTLTTMQISQFVIGVAYAFSHYFIAYQIPISVPYTYEIAENLRRVLPSITSNAASALSTATAAASADSGSWLKKLALRAAGREGLAENIVNQFGEKFEVDVPTAIDFIQSQETRYRDDVQWTHCLDTSGQAFAIWLNIFYLAPLTWLFLQFFIKSYLQRVEERRRSSVAHITAQSVLDARRGVSRRLSEAFEDYQGANGETNEDGVVVDADQVRKELRELVNKAQKKGQEATDKAKDTVGSIDTGKIKKEAQDGLETVKAQAQKGAEKAQKVVQQNTPSKQTQDNIKQKASDTAASVKKSVEDLANEETTNNAADTAEKAKEKANELAKGAQTKAEDTIKSPKKKNKHGKKGSVHLKEEDKSPVKESANQTTKAANQKTQEVKKEEPNDATVQKGKSFADAAAEGVPEDDMGEVVAVDESTEDLVKVEDDEGQIQALSESVTDKISDAMSTEISFDESPSPSLSRLHSAGDHRSERSSSPPLSPTSKRQWHVKRRGIYPSGDASAQPEVDRGTSSQ